MEDSTHMTKNDELTMGCSCFENYLLKARKKVLFSVMSCQEEVSSLKGRMEFIVVASNERQKELESTLSTVSNLEESIQSLSAQFKMREQEIESLLEEEDPKQLSRQFKVRRPFCQFALIKFVLPLQRNCFKTFTSKRSYSTGVNFIKVLHL